MRIATLGIVGAGLVGGSVALAGRRFAVADRILAFDRNPAALARAVALGLAEGVADPATLAQQADLIVFCVPVDVLPGEVLAVAGQCRPGALLTDAGSTELGIGMAREGKLRPGVAFVGSHPLAGSEKSGPEHARADLFEGRLVIVTAEADDEPTRRVAEFWKALGARVERLTAVEHDRA